MAKILDKTKNIQDAVDAEIGDNLMEAINGLGADLKFFSIKCGEAEELFRHNVGELYSDIVVLGEINQFALSKGKDGIKKDLEKIKSRLPERISGLVKAQEIIKEINDRIN